MIDLSGRVLAQSSLRTSAAYGIAHDTEAAGSLALEANLSRGFAGSRVKFLRMHRRLPSSPPHPPSVSVTPHLVLPFGIYLFVLTHSFLPRSRLCSFNFPLIVLPFLLPSSFPLQCRSLFSHRLRSSSHPRLVSSSSVSFASSKIAPES